MPPVLLAGLLTVLSLCRADVKHVLDGTAHPPPCYHPQTQPQLQQPQAVPGSVAFWWADANSPFKQAYDYFKTCSSKDNCLPPVAPSFQTPSVAPSFQTPPEAQQRNRYEKNAFLNGQIHVSAPSTPKIDLSHNPFLNKGVQAAYSSTGQAVTTAADGFLGVQPSVPFSPSSPTAQAGVDCVCIDKALCGAGNQRSGNCGVATQVCCNSAFTASNVFSSAYSNLSHVTAGKTSSGSVFKFDGGAGLSPGSIQVISDEAPIPNPLITNKGQPNPSNSIKVIRNTYNANNVFASTIDYTNDNLGELTFDSAFQGPQYLPPFESPSKPPTPFTNGLVPPVTASNEYLPPVVSTPSPTVVVHIPTESNVNTQYVHTPPHVIYEKATVKPTPGYSYPTPTPTFGYPTVKPDNTNINNQYVTKPKPTPGYSYPTPTPAFVYPTPKPFVPVKTPPKQPKPFVPQPSVTPFVPQPSVTPFVPRPSVTPFVPQPSVSPFVPRPSVTPFVPQPSVSPFVPRPSVTPFVPQPSVSPFVPRPSVTPFVPQPSVSPFVPRPSVTPFVPQPSVSPFVPRPSVTPFVPQPSVSPFVPRPSVPQPIPSYVPHPFVPPTQKPLIPNQSNINQNYITPKPPKPTPVKGGYSYPTPHPPFTIPPYQPQPSNPNNVYETPKPTRPVTTNQYLPPILRPSPEPETGESTSNNGNFVIPPLIPQPNEPAGSIAFPHGSCAAALKCVQEIYCTAEGMISPTPVVLTKEQEFSRVPTTDCFDRQAGVSGKCCRDPNYVDPWPSANNLNGFDDGQYKEDPRLGQYFSKKQRPGRSGVKRQVTENKCGIRHFASTPRGQGIEVNFAEIPWQAMVLRDSNRSLLCGGVIVKTNAVLTAAHCVEGLPTNDILIKGGEWKLGIDEEPLPFQIVKVAAIVRHPQYVPGALKNDLALLMLDEHLRLAKNIAPICLPTPNQAPLQQCITTGWGKRVLQVHLRGAIMKSVNVSLLDTDQCQQKLSQYNIRPDQYEPVFCGVSNNDQCDVDYGSALACTNGDGQYTLTGIFSWDTGCKDSEQIGGYIPADVDWIETTSAISLRELKTLDKQYYQ